MLPRISWMRKNRPIFDRVVRGLDKAPKCIHSILERYFPFLLYMTYIRKKEIACISEEILEEEHFTHYLDLTKEELRGRIAEEHERRSYIEEKTTRYSLAIPAAAGLVAIFANFNKDGLSNTAATILFLISVFYLLASGLTSLRTLRVPYPYASKRHSVPA